MHARRSSARAGVRSSSGSGIAGRYRSGANETRTWFGIASRQVGPGEKLQLKCDELKHPPRPKFHLYSLNKGQALIIAQSFPSCANSLRAALPASTNV